MGTHRQSNAVASFATICLDAGTLIGASLLRRAPRAPGADNDPGGIAGHHHAIRPANVHAGAKRALGRQLCGHGADKHNLTAPRQRRCHPEPGA